MIDFSALVLRPAMAVFGQPITVTPTASQPGAASYAARGVYRAEPIEIAGDDGFPIRTQRHTLGVRRADFATQVKAEDVIALADGRTFWVDRVSVDGQGGADLVLRQTAKHEAIP